jgi:hypothetical protein
MNCRTKPILFLAIGTLLFLAASLIHAGLLLTGYQHGRAATAEGMIGTVLGIGLVASLMRPASAPVFALAVQGFALLGTLVGAFTIAVGVGPQTPADLAFHAILLLVLIAGVIVALRRSAVHTG